MAFKVSAKQQKELDGLIGLAKKSAQELRTATEDFNESMSNIREFVEGLVSDWRETFADRSEKWQESDAAAEAESIIDEWERYADGLEPIEHDMPEIDETPGME